jgi:hypothetical protein
MMLLGILFLVMTVNDSGAGSLSVNSPEMVKAREAVTQALEGLAPAPGDHKRLLFLTNAGYGNAKGEST